MKLQIMLCYRCVYDMIFITLFLKSNHIASWSSLFPLTHPRFAPVSLGCGRLQGMWLIRTTERERRFHSLGQYESWSRKVKQPFSYPQGVLKPGRWRQPVLWNTSIKLQQHSVKTRTAKPEHSLLKTWKLIIFVVYKFNSLVSSKY